MLSFRLKKYTKRLARLRKEYYEKDSVLEKKTADNGCLSCEHYNHGSVDKREDRFAKCSCKKHKSMVELCSEVESLYDQMNELIEGDYSKAVYDLYNEKQPMLVRIRTKEDISWNKAFGDAYENLDTNQKKDLVALAEGNGKYKFK